MNIPTGTLLDAVKHLSLQPMLDFPSTYHEVKDFVDGLLLIFLKEKTEIHTSSSA